MALSANFASLIGTSAERWHPNKTQAENTLRLAMACSPGDVDELRRIIKQKGIEISDDIQAATSFRSFR